MLLARRLRREMTSPEIGLWQALRAGRTGLCFRRQHPIGPYVTDFCCLAKRLVIEVDGGVHGFGDRPHHDLARDGFMQDNGYTVFRISAADILGDLPSVVTAIVSHAARPLHRSLSGPPPRSGEDLG